MLDDSGNDTELPDHLAVVLEFDATVGADILVAVILLGLWNTVATNIIGHYDYRDGVSVWFRASSASTCAPS